MRSKHSIAVLFVAICLLLAAQWNTGCARGTRERSPDLSYGSEERIIEVGAEPSEGFHWSYFLFIPEGVHGRLGTRLLVEPNNSGTPSDDLAFHHERARRLVESSYPKRIARALRTPLLVPVIPRTLTKPEGAIHGYYSQALSRDAMTVTEERYRRVDLQLLAMIDHARGVLEAGGCPVLDEVFMHGFSASASFVTRFALLHPDRVRAIAAGGLNGMPTLPVSHWEDWSSLRFPVGIADLQDLTGAPFDRESYGKISQYLYMGSHDENDTLPFVEAYAPEDTAVLRLMLGAEIMDRWLRSRDIFEAAGIKAQFVTYGGTGHEIKPEMLDDIARFFTANWGDSIRHIQPHGYEDLPLELKRHQQMTISNAIWREDERFPDFLRESTADNQFAIFLDEWFFDQDHRQLSVFFDRLAPDGHILFLHAEGQAEITGTLGDSFSYGHSYRGFRVTVDPEDVARIARNVPYSLRPFRVSDDCFLAVQPGVSLTKRE